VSDFGRDHLLSPVTHAEFRATKDGGVVIDMNTGTCFGLNRVAADVWVQLTTGKKLGAIIDSLRERYLDIDLAILESDIFRLCGELTKANLLRGPT
jgi:hypothetical protein